MGRGHNSTWACLKGCPETIKTVIEPLYDQLKAIEDNNPSKKDGLQESVAALMSVLSDKGVSYNEFIASLAKDD